MPWLRMSTRERYIERDCPKLNDPIAFFSIPRDAPVRAADSSTVKLKRRHHHESPRRPEREKEGPSKDREGKEAGQG